MELNRMSNTLFVAMNIYEGVINLPLLFKDKTISLSIKDVKESNMNKNKSILTSLIIDVNLDVEAKESISIHIYAPRIKINANKNVNEISMKISELLDASNITYAINNKKGEIIISFYSFGAFISITEIEEFLIDAISPLFKDYLKSIESFYMKGHVKGIKSQNKIQLLNTILQDTFKDNIYSKSIDLKKSYFALTNSSYNLDKHIAIYELATNIKKVEGFENAFILYDNIKNANMVTITIRLEKLTDDLWRKEVECTYTIRAIGIITQSTPSIEYEQSSKELLYRAFKQLGTLVIRD